MVAVTVRFAGGPFVSFMQGLGKIRGTRGVDPAKLFYLWSMELIIKKQLEAMWRISRRSVQGS